MDLGKNLIPHKIEKTLVEMDLGILLSSDLKWTNQTVKATKAAKSIIAQLRNSFKYFDVIGFSRKLLLYSEMCNRSDYLIDYLFDYVTII